MLFFKRKKEEKRTPFEPAKEVLIGKFVTDELRGKLSSGRYTLSFPAEMELTLDFTGLRGSGPNIYNSLVFQLPKWDFELKKLDEFIEVTPTWAEYYNITIAQKQKLEGAIKAGMASVAQAVADYELMQHDARRYKEILDYFKAAKTDEHVLRSLFVDRVDAYTGENLSLISMARRWPTIITDFIRMKEGLTDIDKIKKELDVSQAEATVLKTKNELFKEWKNLVMPSIKERYTRIEALCQARKKSIDEYKRWLKPYIATYRMIRERQEAKPSETLQSAFFTPGFGLSQAFTGVRLWAYKSYHPQERHRGEMMRVPGEWKLEEEKDENGKTKRIKAKKKGGWVVFPYDNFTEKWRKKIEEHYSVSITKDDIEQIIKGMAETKPTQGIKIDNTTKLYWMLFDINVELNLLRTPPPAGVETDNLMFIPIRSYLMSQNAMLVHLIELRAREKVFERYVEEILGTKTTEKEIWEKVEKELEGNELKAANIIGKVKDAGERAYSFFEKIAPYFIKVGRYEAVAKERVSKQHNRAVGPNFEAITDLIMEKMQVD